MSLRLPLSQLTLYKSDKVKALSFHPNNPWVVCGHYNGTLTIYDYEHYHCVRAIESSQLPIRSCAFLQRLTAVVAGSDDLFIRVFNYNTGQRIKAHSDFIRCVVVHPTQPLLISTSDDGTIRLWNFEKEYALEKSLSQHKGFVMQVQVCPKDTTKMASCSLDKTIKVWSVIGTSTASNYTIGNCPNSHTAGINCIQYHKGDKPFLASGSDDFKVKVWDHNSKQCIFTLEGHQQNISSLCFHPELPILLTTAEDGAVHLYSLNANLLEIKQKTTEGRAWAVGTSPVNSKVITVAHDQGLSVFRIGQEQPTASFHNGKVIYTKNLDAFAINFKALQVQEYTEGKKYKLPFKEVGGTQLYALDIKHSPNGNLIALCNDRQFSVLKTQAFKNTKFGAGTNLVWSQGNQFAVREGTQVKVFKNLEQTLQLKIDSLQQLFDGPLLGIKARDQLIFYSWDKGSKLVNTGLNAKSVHWNQNEVTVLLETSMQVFQILQGKLVPKYEITEQAASGLYVQGLFFYVNNNGKVYYLAGNKPMAYGSVPKQLTMLGYVESQDRLWFVDGVYNFCFLGLKNTFLTMVSQFLTTRKIQEDIPESQRDLIAKFLDAFDLKKEAFKIVKDSGLKFQLAIQLNDIATARAIAFEQKSNAKIKQVGDLALAGSEIGMAIQAFTANKDHNSLFLIYSSLGQKDKLKNLAKEATAAGKMNLAFQSYYLACDADGCLQVLLLSKRYPQAALFARTYLPQRKAQCFSLWKTQYPEATRKLVLEAEEQQEEEGEEGEEDQ